jgi:hypothetical protein
MKKLEKQRTWAGGHGPLAGAAKARNRGVISAGWAAGKKFTEVSIFTPCADPWPLLKTVNLTASNAAFGDVILFSPACSSFDQFRNQSPRSEVFRNAVNLLADATGGMAAAADPNTQAAGKNGPDETDGLENKVFELASGFFEAKPRRKNPTQPQPQRKDAHQRQ